MLDPVVGSRRLLGAVAVFVVLFLIWLVTALNLDVAAAGPLGLPFNLRSRLLADYSTDETGVRIGSLRLSIVDEALRDLGLSSRDAQDQRQGYEMVFGFPVPTATALNFEGDLPYTATPTRTAPPTLTSVPTATSTSTYTPRPTATRTPPPLSESEPTATPKPSKTSTPLGVGSDVAPPTVDAEKAVIEPQPGSQVSCKVTIQVSGLRVIDPAYSSGIEWVRLKFRIQGLTDYVYSEPLTKSSGGWTGEGGSTWDALYKGSLTIDLSEYDGIASMTMDDIQIELWAKAKDKAGHEGYLKLGENYRMSASCAGVDRAEPQIWLDDVYLKPQPSSLEACSVDIYVENLRVVDPAYSSGIRWVRLKFKILNLTSYIYSDSLERVSGGWTDGTGSTWDARYRGSVSIDIQRYVGLIGGSGGLVMSGRLNALTAEPYLIELWVVAKDNQGYTAYREITSDVKYSMPAYCGSTAAQ